MTRTARTRTRAAVAAPVALALSLTAGLAACSEDSAGPETGADVEDVVEEVATEEDDELLEDEATAEETSTEDGALGGTFQEQTEPLVGQNVTVSATVTEYLSESAIRIGADTDDSLLVLGVDAGLADLGLEPVDDSLVEDERIVQVTGTVRRYDPAEFSEEFGVDYDGLYEDAEGQNVIVADQVETLTGNEVTVSGEVADVISDVAFRLAGVGWDVLVLDSADATVEEGDAVEVMGTVRRFETVTIEDELGSDLDDELYADFEGQLVLLADSVEETDLEQ